MSTKTTTAAIAGVLALGAIGGTAYALNQPEPAETPAAVSTETPAPENTVEPTPTPETSESPVNPTPTPEVTAGAPQSPDDSDAAFLAYVHQEMPPNTTLTSVSDAGLIEAGHQACEVVEAGVKWEDIRLVEGEPSTNGYYLDTSAILNGALYNYCPELIPPMN